MKKRKHKPLAGHEQRTAQSFLRTVIFEYDSRWEETKQGEARKACVPRFTGLFSSSYMTQQQRQAYIDMFAREAIFKFQAPWLIECDAVFNDGERDYIESGQIVTSHCKINDAMPAFERMRDDLIASGNPNHYRYYRWTARVYKGQELYQEGAA
jgi:hypothetical protein